MDTKKILVVVGVLIAIVVTYYAMRDKKELTRSDSTQKRPEPVAVAPPPPPPPLPPPVIVQPPPVVATKPAPPAVVKPPVRVVTRKPITETLSDFDQQVEAVVANAVTWLWSQQRDDGSWLPFGEPFGAPDARGRRAPNFNYQEVGPTALATYALLASGVAVDDPRMAKALDWLCGKGSSTRVVVASGMRKCDRTYSLALRCNVWLEANKASKGKYLAQLKADALQLWNSTVQGGYYYDSTGTPNKENNWDNSNSQYGLLGVWAADEGNIEVPALYWGVVMKHWEKSQNADGGWGYRSHAINADAASNISKGTMTAAGLASLFVCFDRVKNDEFVQCKGGMDYKPIQNGLDWFDRNFANAILAPEWGNYFIYGVERVGMASGYKYFGTSDWYKIGATRLIANKAGVWGSVHDTAFAVLFLIRGRQAVLFNHLQYTGDWNNRPRALASLTGWIGRTFEHPVHWQNINLKSPVLEWHDAPFLVLTGSKKPQFTDAEIDKLRTFVLQGGTLVSISECQGEPFRKGIREMYAKLFPQYELTLAGPEHEIYSDKVQYKLLRPKFSILSNGVRPLAVHCDEDMALLWQQGRKATDKWAYQAAANLVKYASGSIESLHGRGVSTWPENKPVNPARTIKLARLACGGNFDPEPLAYERLAMLIGQETETKLDVLAPMPIKDLPASGATIAALTGTGEFTLTSAEKEIVKKFLAGGGTLILDAAGGAKLFGDAAEKVLIDLFGRGCLKVLPPDHPMYQMTNLVIDKAKYRPRSRERMGNRKTPRLQAAMIDDRPAVILSSEDLTAGLVGYSSAVIDGYEPATAYELMRNVLLYAWQRQQ